MPEWRTRDGKRQCRSDERNAALRRDRSHGCVRVRYQTMGIAGRGNRERPFPPACADLQIKPSQGRLRGMGRHCYERRRTAASGRLRRCRRGPANGRDAGQTRRSWRSGRAAGSGGNPSFPICPACDIHALEAVICCHPTLVGPDHGRRHAPAAPPGVRRLKIKLLFV
jgi:hypothetical protein